MRAGPGPTSSWAVDVDVIHVKNVSEWRRCFAAGLLCGCKEVPTNATCVYQDDHVCNCLHTNGIRVLIEKERVLYFILAVISSKCFLLTMFYFFPHCCLSSAACFLHRFFLWIFLQSSILEKGITSLSSKECYSHPYNLKHVVPIIVAALWSETRSLSGCSHLLLGCYSPFHRGRRLERH